jgi:hypothetical protein
MESGRHAWASVISMRGRNVSLFVYPRQSLVIFCYDNDLRNPHHRWAGVPSFSTLQMFCKPLALPAPDVPKRTGTSERSALYKYTERMRLGLPLTVLDPGFFGRPSTTLGPAPPEKSSKETCVCLDTRALPSRFDEQVAEVGHS